MKLTDIASLETWEQLENESFKRFKLQCSAFNTEGIKITKIINWSNNLCPDIKSTDKGQSFICAAAHRNLANQAQHSKVPVIEECDAGLIKIVVPLFHEDVFLGTFGGCGLILDQGEVDSFAIHKITGIDEKKIDASSDGIPVITRHQAEFARDYFMQEVNVIVNKYHKTVN